MTQYRDNEAWATAIRDGGHTRDEALADLHSLLLARLPYGLSRWLPSGDPSFDALVQDAIQETLIRVVDKFETFEGRSQFTTWAFKIAIHTALNELRRRHWKDVSLDGLDDLDEDAKPMSLFLPSDEPGPETSVDQRQAMDYVKQLLAEELSARQAAALKAVVLDGVPMEEVARRLNTNRNALYKLMHDARLKLKLRLEKDGYSPQELMSLFG